MTKFKVGDRVRRITSNHMGMEVGDEATVIEVRGIGVKLEEYDGGFCWHDVSNLELVETGPVRTVTRKEIVPGKYGHILVDDTMNGGKLVVLGFKTTGGIFPQVRSLFSPAELRAAAATFNELADALDGAA